MNPELSGIAPFIAGHLTSCIPALVRYRKIGIVSMENYVEGQIAAYHAVLYGRPELRKEVARDIRNLRRYLREKAA